MILHVTVPLRWRVGRLAPTLPVTLRLADPLRSAVLLDARRLAWTHGAAAKTLLIEGDAGPVIVTVARELGVDLLVIGSHPRVLPSAVAARTGRWMRAHAPCPVLPVSDERPAPPRPAAEPVLVT